MAEQDVPCPGCGYNLRGCQGTACPECGMRLRLAVVPDGVHGQNRVLRVLFLGLIVWNGAGRLPVAVVEMLRDWQSSGASWGGGGWHFWYVVAEMVHAVLILGLAIAGLKSCRGVAGTANTSRYAWTILWLQVLVTMYHVVIVIYI